MFGFGVNVLFNASDNFHMQIMAFIDEITTSLRLVERQIVLFVSLQIVLMAEF